MMQFESTLNFYFIDTTVTLKSNCLVCNLYNDSDWLLALHDNVYTNGEGKSQTTPSKPDCLVSEFTKANESRISETNYICIIYIE